MSDYNLNNSAVEAARILLDFLSAIEGDDLGRSSTGAVTALQRLSEVRAVGLRFDENGEPSVDIFALAAGAGFLLERLIGQVVRTSDKTRDQTIIALRRYLDGLTDDASS